MKPIRFEHDEVETNQDFLRDKPVSILMPMHWEQRMIYCYECECGEKMGLDAYGEEDDIEFNTCPKCGRKYQLVQSNTIYEIKEGCDE